MVEANGGRPTPLIEDAPHVENPLGPVAITTYNNVYNRLQTWATPLIHRRAMGVPREGFTGNQRRLMDDFEVARYVKMQVLGHSDLPLEADMTDFGYDATFYTDGSRAATYTVHEGIMVDPLLSYLFQEAMSLQAERQRMGKGAGYEPYVRAKDRIKEEYRVLWESSVSYRDAHRELFPVGYRPAAPRILAEAHIIAQNPWLSRGNDNYLPGAQRLNRRREFKIPDVPNPESVRQADFAFTEHRLSFERDLAKKYPQAY